MSKLSVNACGTGDCRSRGGERTVLGNALAVLALSLTLAACGDVEETLSGTAATGAPLVGATVEVACSSGSPVSATTDADGKWTVSLADRKVPCKLRARGGKANNVAQDRDYHSVATAAGTANITPLTDLAVAQLAKEDPATWFGKTSAADFGAIDTAKVTAAVASVVEALGVKTFLGSDNPLTTAFVAKVVATEKIDQALEALKSAGTYATVLAAAQGADFATAAASFKSSIVAALPASSGGGGTPGALACTEVEDFGNAVALGKVRAPTADELSGYLRQYSGSFDHSGSNQYVDSTASLASDGSVTVTWSGGEKTYTGTSFCYETDVGVEALGNTLYVHFAGGKVDLWKKNGTFSGWVQASTKTSYNLSIEPSLKSGNSYINISALSPISGVAKPADQAEFCSFIDSGTYGALPVDQGQPSRVSKCFFAGSTGQVDVIIDALSTEYRIKYVYY